MKRVIGRVTRLALVAMLASYCCVPTPAFAGQPDDNGPVDISAKWSKGGARIDEAGDYMLSADVSAEKPLVIALDVGQSATVDLAGFSATVKGDETCAVDLTSNAGSVTFVDSAYGSDCSSDSKSPGDGPKSSITLETSDPEGDVSVVNAVRSESTRDARPDAVFENVRLVADVEVTKAESYGRSVAALRTGIAARDDSWNAEEESARVSLVGCSLEVKSDASVKPDEVDEGAERGSACAVQAGVRGVKIDGWLNVSVELDGDDAVDLREGSFQSVYDSTYSIGSDLDVPERGNDGSVARDALVFSFPEKNIEAGDAEAVVARAAKGASIPEGACDALKAADGFEAGFEPADDGDGYARLKLSRSASPEEAGGNDGEGPISDVEADSAPSVPEDDGDAGEESSSSQPVEPESALSPAAAHPYSAYLASRAGSVVYAEQLKALDAGTELNSTWKAQDNGLNSIYTISDGGTYYLSDDLPANNGLVVDAAGKDVTLKLNGHVLTLNGSGSTAEKTMLSIKAARSVTIDGATDSGASAIKSAGNADVWGISCAASDCSVSMSDLTVTLSSTSVDQRYLCTHAVRVSSGRLSMTGCKVNMLMGNQLLRSTSYATFTGEAPSAVYATSGAESVALTDCEVVGEGTQGLGCDLNNATSLGNAYAVYSLASSTTLAGGSYKAVSALGNATCLYGTALSIERSVANAQAPVSLEADAGQLATGILSSVEGGVMVNAPIAFTVGDDYAGSADVEAALRVNADTYAGCFSFGDCVPEAGVQYPVLVMLPGDDLSSANAAGYAIGVLDYCSDRDGLIAALGNALGSGCSIVDQNNWGIARFQFTDEDEPVAEVKSATNETTPYPTLAAALDALESGATLKLFKDVDMASIENVGSATLDLNGHVVGALSYSSTAVTGSGLRVVGGAVKGTQSVNGSLVAVYQQSQRPLTLDGVTVDIGSADAVAYGVYAAASTGTVTLKDSKLHVAASRTYLSAAAYGVGMPVIGTGPEIVLDNSEVYVATGSAGAPAYGAFCTNGVRMTGGRIVARGTTDSVGGLFVLGETFVSNAVIDVHATGGSSMSYGFGIMARDSSSTNVTVDSSTIEVVSDVDVSDYAYACLLGATSHLGSNAATWNLSGTNVLNSSGGMHLGYNVGAVSLSSDFALGSGSSGGGKMIVSQAQRPDDVGFTVTAADGEGDLPAAVARLAGLVEAQEGSHYEGWKLGADAGNARLTWGPEGGAGSVSLVRGGMVHAAYPSLASALKDAASGDTVRLEQDLAESGVLAVDKDVLTIDLNGKACTLRAGGISSSSGEAYRALEFTGSGTLAIQGGTMNILLGSAVDTFGSSMPYEGIAVTGGGVLSAGSGAKLNVRYAGSTSSAASQQAIELRGVAVEDGRFSLDDGSELNVAGQADDSESGALGASKVYGVLSVSDDSSAVDVAPRAKVTVTAHARVRETANAYYAETSYLATTNDGPTGLRELTIDPDADADFYQEVVRKFRVAAKYDDPNESSSGTSTSTAKNLGIYYANNMVLEPEDSSAWYNGLRIWAYSDVVGEANAGNLDYIVPTHVFTSSNYEVLPEAYGIATGSAAPSGSSVSVRGSVAVECGNGNAYALSAAGGGSWNCEAAVLSAVGDGGVHPIAQGSFDLRDFVELSSSYSTALTYSGVTTAQVVKFEPAVARDVVVADGTAFSFAGDIGFAASAADGANVEASSFTVDGTFGLKGDTGLSPVCSVANEAGANVKNATFAVGATAAQAGLFEDAYGELEPGLSTSGDGAAWTGASDRVVTFKVGDAVVARYVDPVLPIDLSELADVAKRPNDQRQTYSLLGWSRSPDENATSGFVTGSVSPSGSATYYAVFETSLLGDVPVKFTNIFDASGNRMADVSFTARYGESVADAASAKGVSIPIPSDYTDVAAGIDSADLVKYCFVGWSPYASNAVDSASASYYGNDKLGDLDITLSVNGVSSSGLVLRAVYVAVRPGQHIVTFDVDGYKSVCVVEDGVRPTFTMANNGNTNYTSPAKRKSETGKKFTFKQWLADEDADGTYEASYPSTLPKATSDMTYAADWTSEWASVTYTFYISYYDEAADQLVLGGSSIVRTTYQKSVKDVADGVAKVGSKFGYGGKIYTMDGWSVRKTDKSAIYTSSSQLPDVGTSNQTMNSTYTVSYYGVYSVTDHVVTTTFMDGSTTLGSSTMTALNTVSDAFKATGAKEPQNKSEDKQFLGWSVDSNATANPIDALSVTLDTLTKRTGETLTLHAVYGPARLCAVNLHSADGSKILYTVSVRSGKSVNSAAQAMRVTISAPAVKGSYFTGWKTMAGKTFDLNTAVTGSMDLFASYREITIDSSVSKLSAVVTSTLASLQQAASVKFTVTKRSTADSPLRSTTATHSYTILKSYDIRLVATDAKGAESVVEGDIGTADIRIHVGTKYKKSSVRVFWLGVEDGKEVVKYSAVKNVDSEGYITVSIGNYEVGDADEGGNFVVAYIEGGSSNAAISRNSSGTKLGAGSAASLGTSGATLLSSNSSALAANTTGGLAKGGSSSGSRLSSASSNGSGKSGGSGDANGDGSADGSGDGSGEEVEDAGESMTGSWDSDAVALIALAVVALAAIALGLWHLLVVKQRREEEEAELPAMSDQYARGIHF